jgi:hypothetical protein
MAKRTEKDYEAMGHAVEAGAYTVRSGVEMGATLRMGRPIKSEKPAGKTPVLTVRLPDELRTELDEIAASEGISTSELVRRSVVELLGRYRANR